MAITINAIVNATTSNATAWKLTASGVGVDTQTITIGGVVFTTVTAIGTTAGNVLLGADQAATLANLVTLINAPSTTTSTGVALSAANAHLIKSILGLSATTTATVMTLVSSKVTSMVVSETETNFAWTVEYVSDPIPFENFGKNSLQMIASGITSGNGVFTVDVSNDASNWVAYNRLTTNATNTNAQTDTRVASVTLSSNTSSVVSLPITDNFAFWRVRVVPTTDGTYNAIAFVA